jgi:hypothetical protein
VIRLADMDLQHVVDEGEDDESVAQWRAGHEEFWHIDEARAEVGDPGFSVNDDTLVVAAHFRVVRIVGAQKTARARSLSCPDASAPRHVTRAGKHLP